MDLIDAYYMVSQDLHRQADFMRDCAERLGRIADNLNEQRMREKKPTQLSEEAPK